MRLYLPQRVFIEACLLWQGTGPTTCQGALPLVPEELPLADDRGAVAGRSGLGAVMGSKKLKALVAKGSRKVQVASEKDVMELRNAYIKSMQEPGPDGKSFYEVWHRYGTSSMTARSAHSGDTPVKNWKGIGVKDLPEIDELHMEASVRNMDRHSGCWHCPLGCESRLKAGEGEYRYPAGIRRPEYETEAVLD